MYETWHMIAAYIVGTAAGIGIFRAWIQERIITATIDTLIRDEYVRSYEDEEGMTHLYKWHDRELDEEMVHDVLTQMKEDLEAINEKDDTP